MYCYNDDFFFSDLDELVDRLAETEEEIREHYPNGIEVYVCKLVPIYEFTVLDLLDNITDWPENDKDDKFYSNVVRVIEENVNFECLNNEMPKVWKTTDEEVHFTLEEVIDELRK